MMEIESIIQELTSSVQDIRIQRLKKIHPGDDDFLWFITGKGLNGELQIGSCQGNAPFRIEYDWSKRGWTMLHAKDVVPKVQALIKKRREKKQPTRPEPY